jgi:hypothetical protein
MTDKDAITVLTLLGINKNSAAQTVQLARNEGKYECLAFIRTINYWKEITVHHGLKDDNSSFFIIEIK